MRRLFVFFIFVFALVSSLHAENGRILKVLPQYLDNQGRASISPSLYDRDAYQFYLRQNPPKRSAIQFAVQWKVKGASSDSLRLRVQMIGPAKNGLPQRKTMEMPVTEHGWSSHWAYIKMTKQEYKDFGEVTAWRVTLMDGEKTLAEQKSFLWQ